MRAGIFGGVLTKSVIVVSLTLQAACRAADIDRELVGRVIEGQKLYSAWQTRFVDAVYVHKTSTSTKYERGRLSENSKGLKRYRRESGEGEWRVDKAPDLIEEWVHDGNATVLIFREDRSKPAGPVRVSSAVEVFDASRPCPYRNPYQHVTIGPNLQEALHKGDIDEARLNEQGVAEISWKQRVPESFLIGIARVDMKAVIPQTLSVETRNRKGDTLFSTTATFEKDRDVTSLRSVNNIIHRMPVGDFGRLLKSPEKIETTRMETTITLLEARVDGEQELEPKIFSIEIPLGAKVHDNRTGAEFTVQGRPLTGIDLKR